MRCNIGESATIEVCVLAVVLERGLGHGREVLGEGGVLVRRPTEVAAKAARRAIPGDLGRDIDGAAYGGEVRARRREDGVELDCLVVGCETAGADAEIT